MKEIRTEDAVGHILCHDITQIIKDEKKGVLFKKGHVVKEEDIPLLLSVGKEHLFVWEKKPGILHENEAAEILYKICAGNSSKVHGTEIKEGKIEVVSKIDGILKIRRDALVAVNSLGEMMIASFSSSVIYTFSPSKSTSSEEQPRSPAPIFIMFSRSFKAAFCVAIPVM